MLLVKLPQTVVDTLDKSAGPVFHFNPNTHTHPGLSCMGFHAMVANYNLWLSNVSETMASLWAASIAYIKCVFNVKACMQH